MSVVVPGPGIVDLGWAVDLTSQFNTLQASLGRVIRGVFVTNAGNPIATTTGTTELDLAKLQLTGLTLVTNRYYRVRCQLTFTKTVAADTYDIRLRANTPLSGALVGAAPVNPTDGLTIGSRIIEILLRGNAAHTALFLSVVRTVGTGTLSYYGTSGGLNRTWAILEDLGDTSTWTDIA